MASSQQPAPNRNERFIGDLDAIVKRRFLRVLVVPDKITFFFDGSQLRGAVHEAMQEFETVLNRKLDTGKLPLNFIYIPVRRNEILQMLADGRGDIAAARLPVTKDGKRLVDFSEPTYDKTEAIAVTGPAGPELANVNDLAGKETYQVSSPATRELLAALNTRLRGEGKPEMRIRFADENLDVDDVLEMVNAGLVPMTFAERSIAELWAQVFDHVKIHQDVVVAQGSLAWGVRKGCPQLLAAVNDFVKGHKVGTAFGSTVLRRYLKTTKWINDSTSAQQVAKFQQMIALFRKYGDKYDLPYLLIAAQAYQESRLNNELRNPSGAVGVMQIKPTTAASKPIEIPDVTKLDRNVEAGIKYLRFIADHYFSDGPQDRVNKGLFLVASYNAGPNRIRLLRNEAAAQGLDPDRWFNNVEIVASQRMGRETVQYVSNIYKYYLAYQMVTERMSSGRTAKDSPKP
jgi:membrane-bound lytic murein transglycosylase MltF